MYKRYVLAMLANGLLCSCMSNNAAHTAAHQAVAPIQSAAGQNVTGTVRFVDMNNGQLLVIEDFDHLSPGPHGVHVHEKADLSAADLSSAGPHFNPEGHQHAGPGTMERHAGDLGNVVAGANGRAHLELVVRGLSINGPRNGVVGHSVIVHEKADDLKSQPAGESGARIGGGVIELEW